MFNYWTFKKKDYILPINGINEFAIFMKHLHKLISGSEAFFKKTVRTMVITEQPYFSQIFRHHDKHIPFFRFTVKLLMDDRQHSFVLASHVMKILQKIELGQTRHTQHKHSNFSTSCVKSEWLKLRCCM